MALQPLLEVRNLSVAYSSGSKTIRAIRDISLEVHKGETLALVGETGSGKSTLALAILGLHDRKTTMESGEVLFEQQSIRSIGEDRWKNIRGRRIGIIFQDPRSALNPILTIKDHLMETLQTHQRLSKRRAKTRALELLQEVGIPDGHASLYPFELSGGISQRVGMALAICNNPILLIADEPTSAVDSTIQSQILDLLRIMKRRYGLALLLISHDLALVSQMADRISTMYHGRIVESGLTEEVLSSPAHPYTKGLIQCHPGLQHSHEQNPLTAIPGTIPVPGQNFPGCAFAPRCSHVESKCEESIPEVLQISRTHWVTCNCNFLRESYGSEK